MTRPLFALSAVLAATACAPAAAEPGSCRAIELTFQREYDAAVLRIEEYVARAEAGEDMTYAVDYHVLTGEAEDVRRRFHEAIPGCTGPKREEAHADLYRPYVPYDGPIE